MCECFFLRETDKALADELIPIWETQVDKTNKELTTNWRDASGFSHLSGYNADGSARDLGSRSRGFKSHYSDKNSATKPPSFRSHL